MKETLLEIWKTLKKGYSVFQRKGLQKKARITYGVVWNLFLLFIITLFIGIAFAFGIGAGYFASLVKDEPIRSYAEMKKDINHYEESSNIYFSDHVYLGRLRSDLDRAEVPLNQVSQHMKDALIATEDENFYIHKGVVPKALMRAILQEMTNSSVQSGGSTLTQQIIKNQILTNEVSFNRKAKEVLLALRLEKFFTKDQILSAYLNATTFGRNSSGQNIAGVQAAAEGIFGVKASQLNIPQAAFIAGLPQSPFRYTPFTNQGELKKDLSPGLERMKIVLNRMYKNGYISKDEYASSIKYNIAKDFISPQKTPREKYPWLTSEIESRSEDIISVILAKKDGFSEENLQKDNKLNQKYHMLANRAIHQNGYKIYSTVEKKIYDNMQTAKNHFKGFGPTKVYMQTNKKTGKKTKVLEPEQLGSILIENRTGKILSFVGGRDFRLEQLNHAMQSKRSNGSTMKPLLVYAPAIELGAISPGSPIADTDTGIRLKNGRPWPDNFSYRYYGLVTARTALAQSYNVSAVKVYKSIINQRPAAFLEKMGITSLTPQDYTIPAAALGGVTNGVSVEENVNAYTTFANEGKFIDAYLIDRIEDKNGHVIYQHKSKPVPVFSPQTSYLTLDMMRDVLKSGTARNVPGMLKFKADWAGKTGTSNDYDDSWFVASNPNVTFGTWIGYDTPSSLASGYSLRNQEIWSALMNAAFDADPKRISPKARFKEPAGIVRKSYCSVSGDLPSSDCSKAGLVATDLFKKDNQPKKKDSSLVNGKYVIVQHKKYLALSSTPSEFSHKGVILDPDFVKKVTNNVPGAGGELLPSSNPKWAHLLVPKAKIKDDGKNPLPVHTKSSGKRLNWSSSKSPDVIGYRIYSAGGKKAASIKADGSLSHSLKAGKYYVKAVDIAGKESPASNTVSIK